jgi:hypothetical protein
MISRVIFNGSETNISLGKLKELVSLYNSFSGSIAAGRTMFLFKNVKSEEFDYYIDTFKKKANIQPETEVTFDIRTDAIEAINI